MISTTLLLSALGASAASDLEPAIRSTMARDPAIGTSANIVVRSFGDHVTLWGAVENWSEHYAATQDSFLAGAQSVTNHIHVQNAPVASNRAFDYERVRG